MLHVWISKFSGMYKSKIIQKRKATNVNCYKKNSINYY